MPSSTHPPSARIPLIRAAAAAAAAVGAIYLACWAGTRVPGLTVSHMFLALFSADSNSTAGLVKGIGWAAVFGAFGAAAIAFFYNSFAFLAPRAR